MHTDEHILEHFLAAKHPLPALATHLGMTLIALVHWVDRNADLLAAAKRSLETHLAFLALNAEAAALIDLTEVSRSTTNEERKRKSSSQLLRHAAKRLLTNPTRECGAPCASASTTRLLNQLASSPPSPRPVGGGEKVPSAAKGMRGIPNAELSSTNPERKLRAPCASEPLTALSDSTISPPSPRLDGEKVPSTEGARGMRGSSSAHSLTTLAGSSTSAAESPDPNPASSPNPLSLSDHEVDAMMAALAMHFNLDVKSLFTESDAAAPEPACSTA